ncbi:MAG: DUF4093 domain-containing protein, partial [Alicyclobacillus sp.]|nr:DUF4093 domain-containing protein [Alicyclobacillus sp.]
PGAEDLSEPGFTLADLVAAGLAHHPQAAARRQRVGEFLRIGYSNAKSFVRKLNVLGVTRAGWQAALNAAAAEERLAEAGTLQRGPGGHGHGCQQTQPTDVVVTSRGISF